MSEELYRHAGDIDDELSYYVRAEDAERYARLGRAVVATDELEEVWHYDDMAAEFCPAADTQASERELQEFREGEAAYKELAAAMRAIEEAGDEG